MSSWEEFLKQRKEQFWQLHKPARDFFGLYTKRFCPFCGRQFRCRDCELYPVCENAVDWTWKAGCMCEACFESGED